MRGIGRVPGSVDPMDLVPPGDELGHDPPADTAVGSGNDDTHRCVVASSRGQSLEGALPIKVSPVILE